MDAHQVKHKYRVVADEDTVLGFRCAGVPGVAAADRNGVLQALEGARKEGVGIVIITEEIGAMATEEIDALRFGGGLPMIVEIPGMRGPLPGRRSLSDVIRSAIGVKV